MEGPVMFALTPRAGRWNHRYLVPIGSKWSQQALSTLVLKATENRQRSVISASTSVVQATTGRSGEEMLVLKDERLACLSPVKRDRIQQHVKRRGESLAILVTQKIDWDTLGDNLVVESAALSDWQKEVDEMIQTVSPEGAMPSEVKRTSHLYLITILGFCGLCVIGTVLWQIVSKVPAPNSVPNNNPEQFEVRSDESKSRLDDANLSELAKLLGVDFASKPRPVVEEDIRRGLDALFLGPASVGNPQHDSLPSDNDVSRRQLSIRSSLQLLYQFRFGRLTNDGVDDLVRDDGIKQTLRALFPPPKCELEPGGVLPLEHPSTDLLKRIDAVAFRQIASALAQINAMGPERVPREGFYGAFFRDVVAVDKVRFEQSLAAGSLRTPRFFLDQDADLAQAIESLFSKESLANLLSKDVDTRQLTLVEMTKRIGEERSREAELLSASGIKVVQKNQLGDKDAIKAFELLNKMVIACERAVVDSDTPGTDGAARE